MRREERAEKADAAVQIEREGAGMEQTAPFKNGEHVVDERFGDGGICLEEGRGRNLEAAPEHIQGDGGAAGKDEGPVGREMDNRYWEVLDTQLGRLGAAAFQNNLNIVIQSEAQRTRSIPEPCSK